jgi:stage II sporulation protein R
MKLKKWELALIIAVVLTFICGAAAAQGQKDQQDLADKLVRLHVVANSDSDADQALKLKVRDKILEDVTKLLDGVTDRDKAVGIIEKHMQDIVKDAGDVIRDEGYDYAVTAKITQEDFPTREYETFSLPAGTYTALRVVIGAGAGHNWWCVVFPPMCVTAACDTKEVMKVLSDDQVKLITSDQPKYVVKFKTIEILDKLKNLIGADK